jgi:hypothetical protein
MAHKVLHDELIKYSIIGLEKEEELHKTFLDWWKQQEREEGQSEDHEDQHEVENHEKQSEVLINEAQGSKVVG